VLGSIVHWLYKTATDGISDSISETISEVTARKKGTAESK
jgi:hypothetical protein